MSSGLVWLNLIPSIQFRPDDMDTVIKISESVRRENVSRRDASVDEGDTYTVGLVYAILSATGFVVSFGRYANWGFSVFTGLISPRGIRHLDYVLG